MSRLTHRYRGFTLLEVLIAVVVLAFGLLGVVAVFPAVIDVQRRAQDAVLGGSLAASAEAYVNASVLDSETLDWINWEELSDGATGIRRFPAREVLTNDRSISNAGAAVRPSPVVILDFLWDIPTAVGETGTLEWGGGAAGQRYLPSSGTGSLIEFLPTITFDVGQRLLPDDASGDAPRYVWDAIVRRVDTGVGTPVAAGDRTSVRVDADRLPELPVEVAIFVRPIDRGIRVPAGLTLRDALRGYRLTSEINGPLVRDGLDDRERFFPVAVADGKLEERTPGLSLASGASYSLPITVVPGSNLNDRMDRLELNPDDNQVDYGDITDDDREFRMIRALGQVGQLFIDNFGIVHRVTRVIEDEDEPRNVTIEFSPPLTPDWRQIVFTPQVPADIRVVRTR